jgi:hypothetical protein
MDKYAQKSSERHEYARWRSGYPHPHDDLPEALEGTIDEERLELAEVCVVRYEPELGMADG